jgi:hypothetical protein
MRGEKGQRAQKVYENNKSKSLGIIFIKHEKHIFLKLKHV